MKWAPADCRPGDMVRVKIGSVYHYGIFVSGEEIIAFGLPPLAQFADAPDRFLVCRTDADVFCCGQILEVAELDRKEKKRRFPPEETVRRARERLGEDGYHLIRNNCEHFAYECVFGERRSLQEEAVFRMWNQRQVCNVYLMNAGCADGRDVPMPPERAEEVRQCTDPELRLARTADWLLLRLAAKHSFSCDPDELRFTKDNNGAWTCDRFRFSFSHADGLVCAAVSNAPVGVDLETVDGIARRFDEAALDKLRKRAFTTAEQQRWPATPEGFACGWTRKEALFKCSGKRVFRPGKYDSLDMQSHNMQGQTCVLKEEGRPVLSVCGQNAAHPHLYVTDGTQFRAAEWCEAAPA